MKQIDDDTISLEWTTDDVKEQARARGLDNKLTTDDCRYVLKLMLYKHDADIGVNWNVMDIYIDGVIELKESEQ